ncbi:sensor histidine kinase [Telluria mixta]|uniref:Sensor histidine kinase n=1 Tax=Telluria mixta TaxID=34071 RepID=A0ABT2C0Z2_9BURK|nr:sensor histidine kinase [Telluria mixta]MCS0630334.1 sensor histidine kinase [Telluria mixta]WEM94357.1 sensor histidine kinase [Telluria mixta]
MDLRRRLIGSLGLLLGSLLAMTTLIQLYSLRSDIRAEVDASTRLVNVLAAAGNTGADDAGAVRTLLAGAGLRHLSIRTADEPPPQNAANPLPAWLGFAPPDRSERAIRIGGQLLYIAPNPASEIGERLHDTVQIWITLLFFSGTTLAVTWWCADRALSPVRALEAGLHRLARGEPDPALPAFALREFRRVADAIAHLARTLADARGAQHALARQLITVQEDERRVLARELHDEMGQTLTALNVTATHIARHANVLTRAAVAECATDLRRDVRTCSEQLRAMLKTLRPHGLHTAGLAQTLRELVLGWRTRHTDIDFELDLPTQLPDVGELLSLTVYRVVQEAVTNVVRHSGASLCVVRLAVRSGGLVLEVRDDGRGLPADGATWHGGLLGITERIAMAGGQLRLVAGPAGGLRLLATLPLPATQSVEVPA